MAMRDVLDQSDIDALMTAVSAGEVEQPVRRGQIFSRHRSDLDTVEIKEYDFKRPERISKDQMRSLQTLHEAFARNFAAFLSGFLRTIVEVRVATTDQLTYAEFMASLPNPTSFNLINVVADDLEGQLCLEISPLIIYPMIDRLLGGSNDQVFIPLTSLSSRLRFLRNATGAVRVSQIDVQAEDLDVAGGYNSMRVTVADVGTTGQLSCMIYIMSEPRYGESILLSAIVD